MFFGSRCVFDDHDDVVGAVEQLFGQVIECFRYELFETTSRHVHTSNRTSRETFDNDARISP